MMPLRGIRQRTCGNSLIWISASKAPSPQRGPAKFSCMGNCDARRPRTKLRRMKRCLRVFFIFLISLSLPLTGMAGIEAPTEPCPMQAGGMGHMAGMDEDCCHDMGKMAEHGKKACKTGQECKTGSMLQVSALKPPVTLNGPVLALAPSHAVPDRSPADLWRPPTL